MTMNLVLQGQGADGATIKQLTELAKLAPSARVVALAHGALRCEQVDATPALRAAIEHAALEAKLDATFIAQGRTLADFRLVAMDMDSTLITIECIDEIADMQGLKPQVAAITEAAMRGDLDFSASLEQRVALLKGLDASALQRVLDERLQLSPGALTMLAGFKAAGLKTLLVSGGFTFFADAMKERLGLDYAHANALEIVDGKLTGRVLGTVVDAEEKKRTIERLCRDLGIATQQTIVIGDGANDLKMMAIAGLSVAFRAKPVVRAQADVALNFVGLDGVLTLLA